MKNKLPALTATVLLVAGGVFFFRSYQPRRETAADLPPLKIVPASHVEAAPAKPTAGDQLVLQARAQLERRASIAARLRHQISLNGRQMSGFGGYWQQGKGDDLHMRLELKFFHEDTALLQIANGRFLWSDQRLPAGRSISRLDLRKVRSEWSHAEEVLDELEPGKANWSLSEPELSIRYGGLPTLLSSLSGSFTFMPPQSMRWTPAPPLEGLPESFPVFAVVGHWKPETLAHFLPPGKDVTALPDRLPQEVLVLFGQADLFPYRIEFRKLLNPEGPPVDGHPRPFQLSSQPLVSLELSAVTFDSQIAVSQFDFAPGDAEWDDRTAEYLEAMRVRRQTQVATREQEKR
jgi:hypothetical protein